MIKEALGYEIEDPGNIKERLRFYCELAKSRQEDKEKADKAERVKED